MHDSHSWNQNRAGGTVARSILILAGMAGGCLQLEPGYNLDQLITNERY